MKMKVVGKAHLEGTSKKTGRDYNFNQVHFLGPAFGAQGQAAQTISLDPAMVPFDSIEIDALYNVEFDQRGFCVLFEKHERPGRTN